MPKAQRHVRSSVVQVGEKAYQIELVEYAFREGVEAVCRDFTPPLRVSDRGLGDQEALRLIEDAIMKEVLRLAEPN